MKKYLLHDTHPYVLNFYYIIFKSHHGNYELRYRDFGSTRQEVCFDTEKDAIRYGELLTAYCCVVHCDDYDFEEANKFWFK